jgi:Domain of unknown function (DUF4249)
MKTKLLLLFFWAVLASGCIDRFEAPIRNIRPKLVVEGSLTNETPPYTVKLSLTGGFSQSFLSNATPVLGALVYVQDSEGRRADFVPELYQPGTYTTRVPGFVGTPGRTYSLTVALPDGRTYTSGPQRLQAAPPIDSIYAVPNNLGRRVGQRTQFGFDIFLDTQDPADGANFYRWASFSYAFKQTTPRSCSPFSAVLCNFGYFCYQPDNEVRLLSDDGLNGNRLRRQLVNFSPVFAPGQNFVEVRQYAISRDQFRFWQRYRDQVTRTGSIFDPIPSTIEGNMVNVADPTDLALGTFEVAGITRRRLRVLANSAPQAPNWFAVYGSTLLSDPCPEGGFGSPSPPTGW